MLAVKAPVAEAAPLLTLLSEIVGVPVVFQQMPYAVGLASPKDVMLPLPVAVVEAMLLTEAADTVGAETLLNTIPFSPDIMT